MGIYEATNIVDGFVLVGEWTIILSEEAGEGWELEGGSTLTISVVDPDHVVCRFDLIFACGVDIVVWVCFVEGDGDVGSV